MAVTHRQSACPTSTYVSPAHLRSRVTDLPSWYQPVCRTTIGSCAGQGPYEQSAVLHHPRRPAPGLPPRRLRPGARRHPGPGRKHPARRIPEDAALREAREETGLSQFSIARKLGETTYDITPYRYEIQHRHVFHLRVHEPTERRWPSQELHDGQQPPTRLECFWIPLWDAHVLQAGQGALIGAIFEE